MTKTAKAAMASKEAIRCHGERIFVGLAALEFIALEAYTVIGLGQSFDAQNFGIGLGALATGAGALLKLGKNTNDDPSSS